MALGTPYLSTQLLFNAPTSVSWSLIPEPGATQAAIDAAVTDVIWRATSRVDSYCDMPLRATADTELLTGPGHPRCNVDPNTGNGVIQTKRWPITEVLAIQTALSTVFPRVWSKVPSDQYEIRHPLIYSGDAASATAPDGGWTIDVAQGYISWNPGIPATLTSGWNWGSNGGRGGQRVQVSYINGWPHTSLTQAAAAGDTTLYVDDVTGWTSASGFAYDGAATEPLAASAVSATTALTLPNSAGTAEAGPGTVTLTSGLAYAHAEGTLISALPAIVLEAAIYAACFQALDAGIDALAVQSVSGERVSSAAAMKDLATECDLILDRFRRIMLCLPGSGTSAPRSGTRRRRGGSRRSRRMSRCPTAAGGTGP